MQLRIDRSVIDIALNAVRASLSDKVAGKHKAQRDQAMAVEALGFLALQVLIPMLVSLCSSALYEVLKGRVLAKLRSKELEDVITDLCGRTGATSASLSKECMETLSAQLVPLGFNDSEIVGMYKRMITVLERYPEHHPCDREVHDTEPGGAPNDDDATPLHDSDGSGGGHR